MSKYITFHIDMVSNHESTIYYPINCMSSDIQLFLADAVSKYDLIDYKPDSKLITACNGFYLFITVKDKQGRQHRIDVNLK